MLFFKVRVLLIVFVRIFVLICCFGNKMIIVVVLGYFVFVIVIIMDLDNFFYIIFGFKFKVLWIWINLIMVLNDYNKGLMLINKLLVFKLLIIVK